jgi:hypothetical protein
MAIDITEKQLDILLNGSVEGSFNQRANTAQYDLSVDIDVNANKNTLKNGSFGGGVTEFGSINSGRVVSVAATQFANSDTSNGFKVQYSTNGGSTWNDFVYVTATEFSDITERKYSAFNSDTEWRADGTMTDSTNGEVIILHYPSWQDEAGNYFPESGLVVNNITKS